MIKILIIGSGNVAYHLQKTFKKVKSVECLQISSRNLKNIPNADIAIIAVTDDAIATVSKKIDTPLVVHTSGSISLDNLKNETEKGVFYPLQSFSKNKEVDFKNIPICIEATTKSTEDVLVDLAKKISKKVYLIDSEQRKYLHIAAVFANNFTNHMLVKAAEICYFKNINFDILKPLITETFDKIKKLSPKQAQTGPALRNDKKTIKNHLLLLQNNDAKIYKIITKSIQNGD